MVLLSSSFWYKALRIISIVLLLLFLFNVKSLSCFHHPVLKSGLLQLWGVPRWMTEKDGTRPACLCQAGLIPKASEEDVRNTGVTLHA